MPYGAYTQLLTLSTVTDQRPDLDQITGIAKLINEYGTEVVIISVFLIALMIFMALFLRMFNKFVTNSIKQNEKMFDAFLKLLGTDTASVRDGSADNATINKPANALANKLQKKKPQETNKNDTTNNTPVKKEEGIAITHNIVDNNSRINGIFEEIAKSVMGDLRCNRIAVYVFHNGNKTPYGYSFVKMSCIYEHNMKANVVLRGKNHQGLPLHAFSTIIDCLIKNGEYIIGNVYNHGIISADEQLLTFIDGSKVKSLFALGIRDNNGDIAGFVIAEFNDEQDFSVLEWYNKARSSLKNMCNAVRPIIVENDFHKAYENKEKDAHQ